jgi:hypothetical protein
VFSLRPPGQVRDVCHRTTEYGNLSHGFADVFRENLRNQEITGENRRNRALFSVYA